MISAFYTAFTTKRLELELKIIRHFLLHPDNRTARETFVAAATSEYANAFKRYLRRKPDRSEIDEMLAGSIIRGREQWLKTNLHHLVEFSENRLNQMELILRYALFEGLLAKTVGNILWEYPTLRTRQIHRRMEDLGIIRFKPEKHINPERSRIAWTKATVKAVDRLPFSEWKGENRSRGTIYLWTYLRDAFGLEFPQKDLWPTLERVRRVRNDFVHTSLKPVVLRDGMRKAESYLGNFPTFLVQNAAKLFPKACTEEPPEEDDDGEPRYFLIERLDDYF